MASARDSLHRKARTTSTTERYGAPCGIDVYTYVGDINNIPDATAAVTGEGLGYELESPVTLALLETCPELRRTRDELKRKYGRFKAWTVRTSTLGEESKFRYIFHAVLGSQDEYWVEGMKKLYKALFKKAEKYKVQTLALPLLGSGRAGADVSEAVRAVTESITLIAGRRHLQNIYLLTLDKQHADTIATFCQLYFQNPSAVQPRMKKNWGFGLRGSKIL